MADAYPPIDVLGIPVPTRQPVFLAILAVHVAVALIAVVAGAIAATSRKRAGRHPRAGTVYLWSLVTAVATAAALTAFRPRADWPLLVLGAGALVAALLGRAVRRRASHGWVRVHVVAMGASLVLTLTAFYVDNGPHLPLWERLPAWTFWVLPAGVGVPLILRTLARHPLARRDNF